MSKFIFAVAVVCSAFVATGMVVACSDDEAAAPPTAPDARADVEVDSGQQQEEQLPDSGITCNDDPASSCESCCAVFADGLDKGPCAAPSLSEDLFLGVVGCACSPKCSVVCNESCTTQAFPNEACLACIKTSCTSEFGACLADDGKPPVDDAGADADAN